MENRNRRLAALKQRILLAHDELGFSPELIEEIAAHCSLRRREGRTIAYIAQELGISEWQVADWSEQNAPREQESEQRADSGKEPLTFVLKVPLTYRFERLLGREIAQSMQRCDSCCWKQFLRSLPGKLRTEEDERS